MSRTHVVVIDQDNSWIIREELTLDPSNPVAPQDDYIVVQTGFPIYSNAHSSYSQIVIWGVGLVSFGPVTAAQTAFMANLGTAPDLSAFPGDFVAFGFSSQQLEHFQYGVKDGYVYVTSETNPMISITPDGMTVIGATSSSGYFGMDFGGFVATSASAVSLYFSDLDVTKGTSRADIMNGTDAPETLLGLNGNDHLIGNNGGDHLEGGRGKDFLEGNAGNDRLFGGDDADQLNGGDGNDQLFGGNGDDLLVPGSGFDSVDGGAGIDRLQLDYGASSSSIFFTQGTTIATPSDFSISVTNVEAMIVEGSNYSDVINGTAFGDELRGGNGFDLLRGFAGNDLLDGGTNSGVQSAVLTTPDGDRDTALPIDHFFSLADDANILNSTTVPHATLNVHVHTDQFEFDTESRRYVAVNAQAGATLTIDVDGTDFAVDTRVAILDSNGAVLASNDDGDYSANGFDPGTFSSTDSLLSFTFSSTGTYYVEVTSLVSAAPHSSSFSVNFSLTSAPVSLGDELLGGAGNDFYVVHNVGDTVTELSGEGTDTVQADVSFVLGDNVENLALASSGAIDGTGNGLANTILGNSAANVLIGLGGNDTLNGGGGNDVLNGGAGADRYVFDSALNGATNVDQLVGFSAIDDTIVLDQTIFSRLSNGSLSASRFATGAAAHDSNDRIIYDSSTGNIFYDADGSGGGGQILFAQVAAGTALTNADFLVVP